MQTRNEKVVLIIQARVGSTRLPNKVLLDLAGGTLVSRILERVKRCTEIQSIVLAVPDTKENDRLAQIGIKSEVNVFRGSENDLVDRYYKAAIVEKADIVVRLPCDNPLPEANEIDKIIKHHISLDRRGFTTNLTELNGSGYPDGIGAEVFDFSLLSQVMASEIDPQKREHIHLNFVNYKTSKAVNSDWCPVNTIECPIEYRRPDLVLDVNTLEEYEFIKKIYEFFYKKNKHFGILDIVKWYDEIYLKNIK